jgi:hypothetical protein
MPLCGDPPTAAAASAPRWLRRSASTTCSDPSPVCAPLCSLPCLAAG